MGDRKRSAGHFPAAAFGPRLPGIGWAAEDTVAKKVPKQENSAQILEFTTKQLYDTIKRKITIVFSPGGN